MDTLDVRIFIDWFINLSPVARVVCGGVVLGGVLSTVTLLYALYNVILHPLRRHPGPLLWRAFRFPYVIAVHRGIVHQRMKQYHDEYGPIVRIAPNELSYVDSAAWKDIYSNRPGHLPFKRNPTWFRKTSPDQPFSILGYDEEAHGRFRRAFANSFSEKNLREITPIIESYVESWITQLKSVDAGRQWEDKKVDLVEWFNYLMFDTTGDLSFGEGFDSIKNAKAHYWVEIAGDFGKGIAFFSSINAYPPFHKLLRYIVPKRVLRRQTDHRAMSAAKARQRLALDTDRSDFVTAAKKFSDKHSSMSDKEWEVNLSVLIIAGSETTASALSGIVRELVQSRGVLHRLTTEIRAAFDDESQITIATTGDLSYLNAVINEGLRLCPPTVIGIPRVVPDGGDTICGQLVPVGTYVAVNQYAANRQARNFQNPNSFIPERFLHPNPNTDDMATFQPFHLGRHSCIGMKLAYSQLRLVLARLLYTFEISLEDERDQWDWGSQKSYFLWDKKPLPVKLNKSVRPSVMSEGEG